MTIPTDIPDRAHVLTEQRNPRTMNLHELSVEQCVETIVREDRAVLEAMEKARPALAAFISAAERRFLSGGRLIYVGAGTSGRLGVLDASEAPPTFQVPPGRIVGLIAGGDAALRVSSEGKEDDARGSAAELGALSLTPRDTVVAIAAGGTTPYALGALEIAKSSTIPPPHEDEGRVHSGFPLTALLTCSPVPRPVHADHLIVLETGAEVITGSTRMKAGTATKLALNTISTTLMIREGRVFENLMVDLRATNAKLRDRAARIVATLTGLSRDAAFRALDDACGDVKAAILMHRARVSYEAAADMIKTSGGRLDRAIHLGACSMRHA